ncbi:MarR family winged helix-turn-helix transcriptional regulator, partial [Bradyrhizobium sp.]|uniref:MarR family winged helix-turn-helix transcriptional regulator n=1 Tax=Bradyrhizobium sp. TaxID=376 RepID=UPI003D099410
MTKPSKSGTLTDLVLEIFRLNGLLIASGDALVADIGLTSARWQVVGAIALQQGRAPVAHIANAMGLTRQSVQRIADELARAGIVEFRDNPHHKRARLVTLTAKGHA